MAKYSISICRTAQKELEELETKIINRVFPKIEALASNPIHEVASRFKDKITSGEFE